MLVVSPSYRRAGKVKVRRWWPEVTLAVHEFEAAEYREKEGGNLLVLPDSVRGNMARVRNALLDAAAPGEWVVMLDDDVTDISYAGKPEGKDASVALNLDDVMNLLDVGCTMADDMGTGLWGLNVQADPKFYREYTPFSFSSPVLGPFCVQRAGELRYDERLSLNEDYDLFLQALRKWRRVLRFNRFHYHADHLTLAGGCAAYRVVAAEKDQAKVMQRKWGEAVVRFDFKRSTNPVLHAPVRGI